jgi:hypothetical protein
MALWRTAHDKLVAGRRAIDFLVRSRGAGAFEKMIIDGPVMNMWKADHRIMQAAVPFAFTTEVLRALTQAATTVPHETPLVQENLPEQNAWWYFEEPLRVQTTLSDEPLVAMSMGCIGRSFIVSCWTWLPRPTAEQQDPVLYLGEVIPMIPSQVFTWELGESITAMLDRCRSEHRRLYGPGGQYHKAEILGEEAFMDATIKLATFILATVAWLNQKVAITEEHRLDRGERRRIEKQGRIASPVKLVYLRRLEQSEHVSGDGHREYSCRFVVDGHWRLQACGPRHTERKLTYVHPYVKGPADKPLKTRPTAYVVNR